MHIDGGVGRGAALVLVVALVATSGRVDAHSARVDAQSARVAAQGAAVDGAAVPAQQQDAAASVAVAKSEAQPYREPLEVQRADGLVPILVPRDERLEFNARVKLVGIEADAGRVTLTAGVKPFQGGLFARAPEGAETASIEARARGEYGVYSMDSRIETVLQPQEWPALVYRFTQTGTEQRRREILVGRKDGEPRCSYRSDTSSGAPRGARIWRDAQLYGVPAGTVDTLGAVYVVRSMIRDDRRVTTLNTLDKERVWEAALSLGDLSVVETPAGNFAGREVHLTTRLLTRLGEAVEPDPEDEGFSGPFGIRGQIRLFVEANTGVPIAVSGTIPAGPIDIGLDLRLTEAVGTPPGFEALDAEGIAALEAEIAAREAARAQRRAARERSRQEPGGSEGSGGGEGSSDEAPDAEAGGAAREV